jgi:hypothetical protein
MCQGCIEQAFLVLEKWGLSARRINPKTALSPGVGARGAARLLGRGKESINPGPSSIYPGHLPQQGA